MASRPGGGDSIDPGHAAPSTPDAPSPPTSVGELLRWATRVLETIGAADPVQEAATLLGSVTGSSSHLLESDGGASVAASQVDRVLAAIARRTREEPTVPDFTDFRDFNVERPP